MPLNHHVAAAFFAAVALCSPRITAGQLAGVNSFSMPTPTTGSGASTMGYGGPGKFIASQMPVQEIVLPGKGPDADLPKWHTEWGIPMEALDWTDQETERWIHEQNALRCAHVNKPAPGASRVKCPIGVRIPVKLLADIKEDRIKRLNMMQMRTSTTEQELGSRVDMVRYQLEKEKSKAQLMTNVACVLGVFLVLVLLSKTGEASLPNFFGGSGGGWSGGMERGRSANLERTLVNLKQVRENVL